MPTERIVVDSDALDRTGQMARAAATTVESLRAEALQIVTSGAARGAFGNDAMGQQLAAQYSPAANAMVTAITNVQDAFTVMGDRLTTMARNYATTEEQNTALASRFGAGIDDPLGGSGGGSGGVRRL